MTRRRIPRAEVEASLRDLFGEGQQAAKAYAGVGVGAAGAMGFLALCGAFLLGKRKGRRRAAVVEIRRA
jgi:hypothetical protein